MKVQVITLFAIITCLLAQNPGAVFNVRQNVIDEFKDSIMDFLLSKLKAVKLPNFGYGGVHFQNLVISSPGLNADNTEVLLEDGYVTFGATNFTLEVSGHAQINLWLIKFNQNFDLVTTGNVLTVAITPVMDKFLHLHFSNVTAHIGGVHFTFGGWLGRIESWIINMFSSDIAKALNAQLANVIQTDLNNGLNDIAYENPTQLPVGDDEHRGLYSILAVNYTFVNSPAIKPGYIYGGLNGTVYVRNNSNDVLPYSNNVVLPTVDNSNNNGLQFFLSQYVINTALYAMQSEGLLKMNITNNNLPKNMSIQMNTNSLNLIFPGLTKKFGNNQPCYLFCIADNSTYPKAYVLEGLMGLNLTQICSLYAQYATTQQWGLAASFRSTLLLQGGVMINATDNKIHFNVSTLSLTGTSIIVSNIGFLQGSLLQLELNTALAPAKILINTFFRNQGIPLPQIPLGFLQNATVALHNGYIEASVQPNFFQYQGDNEDSSEQSDESSSSSNFGEESFSWGGSVTFESVSSDITYTDYLSSSSDSFSGEDDFMMMALENIWIAQ